MTDLVYYELNVNYNVGGRFHRMDPQGFMLDVTNRYVAVPKDALRDFKIANKRALLEGLIKEVPEPPLDWEINNDISDSEAKELLAGNYLQLKQKIEKITSLPIIQKMLELAKESNRPAKTIKLLDDRASELEVDYDKAMLDIENRDKIV